MDNIKVYGDIPNFDEDDDIILPDTIWGEIVYITYILVDMIQTRKYLSKKWFLLKRQVYFSPNGLKSSNIGYS